MPVYDDEKVANPNSPQTSAEYLERIPTLSPEEAARRKANLRPQELANRENSGSGSNPTTPSSQVKEATRAGVQPTWKQTNLKGAETSLSSASAGMAAGAVGLASGPAGMIKTFTGKLNRKNTTIGVTIGVVVFAGVAGFSFVQGPLKIIHFGKLLSQFHLTTRQNEVDSRTSKLTRYIYHQRKPDSGAQNVRLGLLANKYADKIETKMSRSGLQTSYTAIGGWRNGYTINPNRTTNSDLEKFIIRDRVGNVDRQATADSLTKNFKDQASVDIRVTVNPDGTFFISDPNGNFNSARFNRFLLGQVGYSGPISALNARTMGVRAGIVWGPIARLDKKILLSSEEKFTSWLEERKEARQRGGDSAAITRGSGIETDPDNPNEENEQKAREADQERNETREELARDGTPTPEERKSQVDRFLSSKGFRFTAGSTAAIGLACLVKEVADGADEIKETQVILPAMRIAGDYVSLSSSTMAGEVNIAELGYFSDQMDGIDASGEKSSWYSAKTIQAELGNSGGKEPTDTLKTIGEGSPFDRINQGALGTAVGAACSTAGQIISSVIGIATGPISFVAGTAAGWLLGPVIIDQLADWISGEALNTLPVGADLGNTAMYGGALMARSQGSSNLGRPLDRGETAQNKLLNNELLKTDISNKSFVQRTFDITNPMSLTSVAFNSTNGSPASVVARVFSPAKSLTSSFSSITTPSASASDRVDYSFDDIGYSQSELNNELVENPFENAEVVLSDIAARKPEYIERAKKCGGIEIDTTTFDVVNIQAGKPTFKDMEAEECKDTSEDYLRFRMYVFDTIVMMNLACYEADENNPDDAEGVAMCREIYGVNEGASSDQGSGEFALSEPPNQINGYELTPNEKKHLKYIAENVQTKLEGSREEQAKLAAESAWWALRESVLALNNPFTYSNCGSGDGNTPIGPTENCTARTWQVGIGAVQVPPPSEQLVKNTAQKLNQGKSETEILGNVAELGGFDQGSATYNAIVGSSGSVRKSLLLRDPATGVTIVNPYIREECLGTILKEWCISGAERAAITSNRENIDRAIAEIERYFLGSGSAGSLPSGNKQQLAKQILDSGKVTITPKYLYQVQNIANGNNECNINLKILQLLAVIAQHHSIYVTSMNRFCTKELTDSKEGSFHWREGGGHAVDIGTVDGVSSTGGTSKDIQLLERIIPLLPSGSGVGQEGCRSVPLQLPSGVYNVPDTCNHIHIQVPVEADG